MTSEGSKDALRQSLRVDRNRYVLSLSPERRAQAEDAAATRLLDVLGDGIWASYLAMGSEINPVGIAERAPLEQAIAYPWFESRASPMIFRLGRGKFTRGPFGVRQPDARQPEARPHWVVVPLVGADPHGNRIGQGAGHYDRMLETLRAGPGVTTIGLAWDVQLIDSIPADSWDQPLDFIITPSRTIRARP